MIVGPWLVGVSLAACLGTLYLIWRLWPYREKPGAQWFLASLGCQAVASIAHAGALLSFDPAIRLTLEVVIWASLTGLAVFFYLFALGYTGRLQLLDPWWMRLVFAIPLVVGVVGLTNPLHSLAWTGFTVEPMGGVATVSYDLRSWILAAATIVLALPLIGSVLLFDTVFSYGRLYRREAVAVGLSTLPPITGVILWIYGIGPGASVNLFTLGLVPHILLDADAFVRSDMFEFHPATRRTGERAAINDLGNPVAIVDEEGRIATMNDAAESLFGQSKAAALTTDIDTLVGEDLDPAGTDTQVTIETERTPRIFNVSSEPLHDGRDTHVGYTVVFQDITDEIEREQRLEVLNRVLRHNVRNDMTVVRGYTTTVQRRLEDAETTEMLTTVQRKADELVELSEKARAVERTVARDPTPTTVDLTDLLKDEVATVRDDWPDATVRFESTTTSIHSDEEILRTVLGTILENAVEHSGNGTTPEVTVTVAVEDGTTRIDIADNGPGIPDQELSVIEAGTETDLEHSAGLGLWLAVWGTRQLGGTLTFDVDDAGTTATLCLPTDISDEDSGVTPPET
jgi:PAS domain S-box-containing protein